MTPNDARMMTENPDRTDRRNAYRRGHAAEHVAALALRLKGYSILAQRFRCPAGEIDLIARRGTHIAFIEVKARASEVAALEAVSRFQVHRILRSAEVWLGQNEQSGLLPDDYSASFDLMLVAPFKWPKHLQAAFDATM